MNIYWTIEGNEMGLVEMLREEQDAGWTRGVEKLFKDAADEIEKLQAELAEAVSAVRRLSEGQPFDAVVVADGIKRGVDAALKAQPAQSEPITDQEQADLYRFTEGTPHYAVVRKLYRAAQPAQSGPVAVVKWCTTGTSIEWLKVPVAVGTKLYTTPQPSVERDAARLDWIVRQADEFSIEIIKDAPGDGDYICYGMGKAFGQGKTYREAIDAAMKKGE